METIVETIEGTIGGACWFQYDLVDDVLYLHLEAYREADTTVEPRDPHGRLLRDATTGEPVGLTLFHWWMRHGEGERPDSMTELARRIEPWATPLLPAGREGTGEV
jgi:hypothetical protein